MQYVCIANLTQRLLNKKKKRVTSRLTPIKNGNF